MKPVNAAMFAVCLLLGTGSVFAQANEMGNSTMSQDKMTQASKTHHDMKKGAMKHEAMKGAMPKNNMAKDAMPKNGDAMKDDMGHDMGSGNSQH
jgi:pentapeptide MXKDX repeat protein